MLDVVVELLGVLLQAACPREGGGLCICAQWQPQSLSTVFVFQNLTREQADYCISHMKPYMDGKGRELPSAYDYIEFTRSLFVN